MNKKNLPTIHMTLTLNIDLASSTGLQCNDS